MRGRSLPSQFTLGRLSAPEIYLLLFPLLFPLLCAPLNAVNLETIEYGDYHHNWTVHEKMEYTTKLLESIFRGYDRYVKPCNAGCDGPKTPPLVVELSIYVFSIGPLSEKDMTYSIDCYFRQYWRDPRLKHTSLSSLALNSAVLGDMWRPDTLFYNGQSAYLHKITQPNKFLRIGRNGDISYSQRLTIKASCHMQLRNYPMDVQSCRLEIGSMSYSEEEIVYEWRPMENKTSVDLDSDIRLSQFDMLAVEWQNGSAARGNVVGENYFENFMEVAKASPHLHDYSVATVTFHLNRRIGWFVINIYVPLVLLVTISWVSFWIHREAAADRVSLGIMTILTMAFLCFDLNNDLPQVNYRTAIDIYVYMCYIFVFVSLVQFAAVHHFTKYPKVDDQESSMWRYKFQDMTKKKQQEHQCDGGYSRPSALKPSLVNVDSRAQKQLDDQMAVWIELEKVRRNDTCNGDLLREELVAEESSHLVANNIAKPVQHKAPASRLSALLYARKGGDLDDIIIAHSVSRLDILSRYSFPGVFLLFNLAYWRWYFSQRGVYLSELICEAETTLCVVNASVLQEMASSW